MNEFGDITVYDKRDIEALASLREHPCAELALQSLDRGAEASSGEFAEFFKALTALLRGGERE
jgi:hypothetical protein